MSHTSDVLVGDGFSTITPQRFLLVDRLSPLGLLPLQILHSFRDPSPKMMIEHIAHLQGLVSALGGGKFGPLRVQIQHLLGGSPDVYFFQGYLCVP